MPVRLFRQFHVGRALRASARTTKYFLRESPVVHKKTWLEALETRKKLLEEHPEATKSGMLFAHNDVKTREVAPRSTEDSFSFAILPFKDRNFLDGYINAFGRLRMGQLFMDLDRLSGIIANKHCLPAEPVIVTASVDRILLLKRLENVPDHNVVLWGYVSWTGRSSMEITIHASSTEEDFPEGREPTLEQCRAYETWLISSFTFVARDPVAQRAFPINTLTPRTRQELSEFVSAEKFNERKKLIAKKESLTLRPPSEGESALIHNLWLESEKIRHAADNGDVSVNKVITMGNTKVYSTGIMQPQYRNRHSYMIFGGYMMRQTFEVAYACAGAFSHLPPRFVSLDTVTFRNPVPVGSVLHLTALVAYTKPTQRIIQKVGGAEEVQKGVLIQIRVSSVVRGLASDDHKDAGTFIYSFFVEGDAGYRMIPESYEEMMIYLDGKRQVDESQEFLDNHCH